MIRTIGASLLVSIAAFGACGDGQPEEEVPDVGPAVEISVSNRHSCARFATGAVACWGGGILGDGVECEDSSVCSTTPSLLPELVDAVSIAGTCAVRASGEVVCWGLSTWGDDAFRGEHLIPTSVPGISSAVAVSTGSASCALLASGSVSCWGMAQDGALGDGDQNHEFCTPYLDQCSRTPVQVANLTDAVQISIGGAQACAIRATGAVVCWGERWLNDAHWTPQEIVGLSGVVEIATGRDHACALTGAGTVSCWGANYEGQLGDGTTTARNIPTEVPGLTGVSGIAASRDHVCAVHESGRVSCWGANDYGQLGEGGSWASFLEPVEVLGLDDAAAVAAGLGHTCAIRASGTMACWGINNNGQLGDGTTEGRFEPVAVLWP